MAPATPAEWNEQSVDKEYFEKHQDDERMLPTPSCVITVSWEGQSEDIALIPPAWGQPALGLGGNIFGARGNLIDVVTASQDGWGLKSTGETLGRVPIEDVMKAAYTAYKNRCATQAASHTGNMEH